MRTWICAAAALSLLGCGEGDVPAEPVALRPTEPEATNTPPVISDVRLQPSSPRPGDTIVARSTVNDPEGDAVEVRFDWYVDRRLYREGSGGELGTTDLRRGSEIYARVRARDAFGESIAQTPVVVLGNALPRVTQLRIAPERPNAGESLIVDVQVQDLEQDPYDLTFAWFVNGQKLEDVAGSVLEPGRAKRGDEVVVQVTAVDSEEGPVFVSEPVRFANAKPEITSRPTTQLATETGYRYQIQASDPDGDRPLRYSLVEGPDGMTVDLIDGTVEWEVPSTADGRFPIEISVKDAYGGEARQDYVLEFHWEAVPANADGDSDRDDSEDDDEY